MDKKEILAFESAVLFFNEIVESKENPNYSTYQIIWKTNLGLATANAIHYTKYDYPIIFEAEYDFDTKAYQPQNEEDLFAVVRRNVFDYFEDDFMQLAHTSLPDKPELLLDKLLELSHKNISDDLKAPNYSSLRNFKTLDKSIDLPFITSEAVKIECVASLIPKKSK